MTMTTELPTCHFCDEPIYDIEKLSLALSYVIEPEYLTFAEGIKIDDNAIFVQDDPFYNGQKGKRIQTQDHNFFIFFFFL
jgi:hypothetical protein